MVPRWRPDGVLTPFLLRLTRPQSTFPCHLSLELGAPWGIVNTDENRSAFSRVPFQLCSSARIRRGAQIGYGDGGPRCGACLAGLGGSWELE